jgi:hypothetical protein
MHAFLKLFRDHNKLVGIVAPNNVQFSEVVVDGEQNRILFMRPLDGFPGMKQHLEVSPLETLPLTFIKRKNKTPWKFDSWELMDLFRVDLELSPPR